MIIAILNEEDSRIAVVPESIDFLNQWGLKFIVDNNIKNKIEFNYQKKLFKSRKKILLEADIFITLNPLTKKEIKLTKENAIFISRFAPYDHPKILSLLENKLHTVFSLDMIPRITVAQSSDVLSSLASLAGYKAVLLATEHFSRYIPMLTTAAGAIAPAKVMVLGAGVAGLQAIATAKRLGAVVSAFDTRTAAKTEVMSLGAKFIEVKGAIDDKLAGGYAVEQDKIYKKKQREEIYKNIIKNDIIITTAQVRGKPAPRLIDEKMINSMNYGSVIVDMASATGGNCEFSQDGKIIKKNGVTIIGNSDLSKKLPYHASVLFSRNVVNFFKFMVVDGKVNLGSILKMEHKVVKKSCIVYQGKKYD